jgi:outer membrane protein OmpA-like peptidoglycan-associated protein/tetratricopeptide (TPR) repeat protein
MKNIIVTLIAIIGFGFSSFAQEKSSKELNGDKQYFVYAFDKAIVSYTDVNPLTTDGQRKLAKSYHNIDRNVEAEAAYAKLVTMPGGNLPEDYYNYSMVLKMNGKNDEANIWADKYFELKPNDLRAKDYEVNKSELFNLSKDDSKYKIIPMKINTDAEDFGASYYKNKIVFASSRSTSKKTYNWNRKAFLDMYVADIDGGQLKDADKFDKSLNGKMHNGPASFSNDGNFMAFSKNNSDDVKDHVIRIEIYFSTYKDGAWSKPESFILNSKEYSVGQPCLTSDGNTMYFSSDMPGGFGGVDIYRITKNTNGAWGKAENLGNKINTEGDELFPFFEEKNGVLFFSSNGRFGLGGLDIFYCAINGSEVGRVNNAGYPLNTKSDDFAVIINDKLTSGYFSSNRNGGSGSDDIYGVDFLKPLDIGKKIQGIAKENDGTPIPGTFITLSDDKDLVIDTMTAKADGSFSFLADANKNFKLNGKKENYSDGNNVANTFGKEFIVNADVILLKKVEVIVEKTVPKEIPENTDLGKALALNNIYFDLDKYNIRPDAEIELAKIIKTMNDNPDMIVELRAHTDCRETKEYNQTLSDKRATASAQYIKQRITKPERISGKGYGKSQLVNGCTCEDNIGANCSETEHQKNRRTEFIIVKRALSSSSQ